MSEFSYDGRLVMETKFASNRLDTYRAYKFPWIGRPAYPPTLVSDCCQVNGSELSTVFHVRMELLTLHIGAFMPGLIRLASEPRLDLLSSLGLRRRLSLEVIWIGCEWRR